jgi:hypothetical protein
MLKCSGTREMKCRLKDVELWNVVLEWFYHFLYFLLMTTRNYSCLLTTGVLIFFRAFNRNYNSYLCIKGIIRRLWHEGMFKARGTRAFKFPRPIIDNYARGTYNVLFYFIISKRFKQIFIIP